MKCGFIGLGSQGAPMARRMIEAGLDVGLWARRPETLDPFKDSDAHLYSEIGDLAAEADHVGVCVVDDAGVRQVCGALLPKMRHGARLAIHSTIHPDTCVELAEKASGCGISLIDAPVSGGQPAAEAGKLTVMVGGDADAVKLAQPIFQSFGGLIVHLGDVGAGQKAKLINNSLMTAHMALAHNSLAAGESLGLSRDALIKLINASSGRSFGFEIYARLPSPDAFVHGAALLAKDVRLLGEVMGEDENYKVLRDDAVPFLELACQANNSSS